MMPIGDKELVRICLQELFETMGYPEVTQVPQSDLEHLCYQIEDKTKINISLSTIKRIVHGKFERLPHLSTLDALTIYLGYAGWQDFKSKKNDKNAGTKIAAASEDFSQKKTGKPFFSLMYVAVIAGFLVVGFFVFRVGASRVGEANVDFSIQKIVSEGVPNNVIFHYDIDNVPGDSFYIQSTWNKDWRTPIEKHNHIHAVTYYEPGYHTAKLICDNKILKEVPINITTHNDWMGYSKTSFFDLYPEYFRNEYLWQDSVLGMTVNGLIESDIKADDDKIYYYAYFPDTIPANSDNFKLKARVRMKKIKNTLCPWIIVELHSDNSFFFFKQAIPGCTGEIQAMFSDKYFDGRKYDLSSLGYDVQKWSEVEIYVVNRKVFVSIEGNEVFDSAYTRPGGAIRGLAFGSNGLCEVDYVELQDANNKVIYRNDFNNGF